MGQCTDPKGAWVIDGERESRYFISMTLSGHRDLVGKLEDGRVVEIANIDGLDGLLFKVNSNLEKPPKYVIIEDAIGVDGEEMRGFSELVPMIRSQNGWGKKCIILGMSSRANPYEDKCAVKALVSGCTLFFHKDGLRTGANFLANQVNEATKRHEMLR